MQGVKPTSREEDPELAAALAMSMEDSSSAMAISAEPPLPPTASSAVAPSAGNSGKKKLAKEEFSKWPLTDEPASGTPNSTRIQIRLASGKSVVRRFLLSDPVGTLKTLVRQEVPEAQSREFDLNMTFPRKSLQPMLEMCIKEVLQATHTMFAEHAFI